MEFLEHQALLGCQVKMEHTEPRGPWDQWDQQVLQESVAYPDPVVEPVRTETMDRRVNPE